MHRLAYPSWTQMPAKIGFRISKRCCLMCACGGMTIAIVNSSPNHFVNSSCLFDLNSQNSEERDLS